MLSNNKLTIKPSSILFGYYLFFTLAAFVAAFFIDFSFVGAEYSSGPGSYYVRPLHLSCGYILIVAGVLYCKHFSKHRISRLEIREDGSIDLQSERKTFKNQKLLPSSRVFSNLVILNFRRHNLIILPDSLDKDIFRRLKVQLRYSKLIDQ